MADFFSLWDTESGNIVNTFEASDDALRVAAELISEFGASYADALELSWTSDHGEHRVIATGKPLIALAHRSPRRRATMLSGPMFRRKIHQARERAIG